MTSRRLFFKLTWQDIRKRIWCPIILFIAFFLTLEVELMVMLENIINNPDYHNYDIFTYFNTEFLGRSNVFDLMMVVIAATVCAISGFSYLHSKMQIDTYHSMPVRRITLFFSKYVAGILIFAIPYVIHMLISLLIGRSRGAYTDESFMNMLLSLGVRVSIFMIVYTTSTMAVCLTGNIIISVLAVAVLNVYSLVIDKIVENLFIEFILTFTTRGYKGVWSFSPIAMIARLYTSDVGNYNYSYIPKVLLGIVAYTVIAAVLYVKRSSESAGHAIAFKWAEPIVKTMCVIPVALFSGMFFSSLISDDGSYKWYIFGMVFGYVIVALIMEVIFRMDIKGVFKHKKQFMFNAVCTALIFVIFRYDVLGYNTYVPNDSELQSCSVSLGLGGSSTVYGYNADGTYYVSSLGEYIMETMELKGNPSVTELARKIATGDLGEEYESENYEAILFGYNLLNGKQVYRVYYVNKNDDEIMKLVSDVFEDYNYKIGSAPIFTYGQQTKYEKVDLQGKYNSMTLDLTPELQAELLEAYKDDYTSLKFDTVMNEYPIGTFEMYILSDEGEMYGTGYSSSGTTPIYPTYTNTIKFLEDNGFDINYSITAADVKLMTVTSYKVSKTQATNRNSSYYSATTNYEINITDKDQINEILGSVENTRFKWSMNSYNELLESRDKDYYEIYIEQYSENGGDSYSFRKDCVPEFMSELGK